VGGKFTGSCTWFVWPLNSAKAQSRAGPDVPKDLLHRFQVGGAEPLGPLLGGETR
jgi:hypothetical protein